MMIILISSFDKRDIFTIFSQLILILFVKSFDAFVIINYLFFLFMTRIIIVRAFNAYRKLFVIISCCVCFVVIGRVIVAFFITLTKMVSMFFFYIIISVILFNFCAVLLSFSFFVFTRVVNFHNVYSVFSSRLNVVGFSMFFIFCR